MEVFMNLIKLNNGVEMPVIGFGTFKITDSVECEQSVVSAIRAGYRMIDTAQAYGNEEAVGAGIKNSGVARDELFITTKIWFRSYEAKDARESVLLSMEKLGVEYLDLVLLHWPFGNYYNAWRELEKLYEEGKIRAIGISNFNPDRMIDLISFNKIVPAINQIETHLMCQRKLDRQWMAKYKVQPVAYAPLGQGRKSEMFSLPVVTTIANGYGKTPAQVMLRFLTQQDIIVIPKSTHQERILENIDIFDFTLTDMEMEQLSAVDMGIPISGNAENPEKVEIAMTW